MQIDINSRKQLNKPENYAAFYSLLNRLPVHGGTYHESA